jgi:hypothetical protein
MDLGTCSLDYLVQGKKVTRESTSFLYAGEAFDYLKVKLAQIYTHFTITMHSDFTSYKETHGYVIDTSSSLRFLNRLQCFFLVGTKLHSRWPIPYIAYVDPNNDNILLLSGKHLLQPAHTNCKLY